MNRDNKKSHHHGDLRETLINSAIELLNEGGLEALSLRKCATKAGVSHAAPAHHFDGLNGLLNAVAGRGMSMLARQMQQQIDSVPQEPLEKLHAMCQGYIDFDKDNHALAHLMFNRSGSLLEKTTQGRSGNAAYTILVEVCAAFACGQRSELTLQYTIWSLLQGYVQLSQMGQIKPDSLGDEVTFFDLLAGLSLEVTP